MKRPVWAEIDLGALAHNIQEIRRVTVLGSEIMAVVKANAYGHGLVEVSRTVLQYGASALGVAILEEGLALRRQGFTAPVLILGYTLPEAAEEVVAHDLSQTIFSYRDAVVLSEVACKLNKTVKVHLKIDTGMGRLGFVPSNAALEEIRWIAGLPNLEVEGVFTHFARADETEKSFTELQFRRFLEFIESLSNLGLQPKYLHAANSGAVVDLPKTHLNMVRPGLLLYGLYPSDEVNRERIKLKPVMSLKARVAFVKEVLAGSPISYGGTYVTLKETRIATLPLGYADGYSRLLSNKAEVLIRGKRAPVVGRVCMDNLLVDVGDLPEVSVGDEAVLFGEQAGEKLPVEELAEKIGTINYELVCMVSERVPRVYVSHVF